MDEIDLLDRIETFLEGYGMTATAFGRAALNDPRFVFDLREGRQVLPSTAKRVVDFISRSRAA